MELKILLNGAQGRMGAALRAAIEASRHQLAAGIDQGDSPEAYMDTCNVVIDFSYHAATAHLVETATSCGKPVVIGTTGHNEQERERIAGAARSIPLVWAGNYSVGVNLLQHLVERAAGILGPTYHPEVLEMHHRHKVDAPSGTACDLIGRILAARGWEEGTVHHGREGITGERPDQQLGVHALRGGDIVGEHTVYFAGPGERIELTHRAYDRGIFAQGAITAAEWVVGKAAGIYSMQDVLGLS